MRTQPTKPLLVELRRKYGRKYDVVAMAVYTLFVYSSGLFVYPLGRDYDVLAAPADTLPFLVREMFIFEANTFGAGPAGYHVVNIALLYGCMLCLCSLVHKTVQGPHWLGTLAAVLFMANPVHAESVLNLSGVADLVPCLFALAALLAYASLVDKPRYWKWVAAPALFALAVLPYQGNVFLIAVLVLYEFLMAARENRRLVRLIPFAVISLVGGFYFHRAPLAAADFIPARAVSPLYFLIYPIGFLPETARNFHESPWLGWVAGAMVLAILYLIHRKAQRPVMVFGILSAVAVRMFQDGRSIDPVHLVGGGQLLLANALFNIALVALFFRIMDHPKWRTTVVLGTTLLCAVFFVLQIRANLAWHHAGRQVELFQRRAQDLAGARANGPLGILPDYQYYRGAPLCLSKAIAHDTVFSKAVPAIPLLPLHYDIEKRMRVAIHDWSDKGGTLIVDGKRPIDVAVWPYTLSLEGAVHETDLIRFELTRVEDDGFTISIRARDKSFPHIILPGDNTNQPGTE